MAKRKIAKEEFLSGLLYFTGLDKKSIRRLARATGEVNVQHGNTLFRRGDTCNGFHIVVTGLIKLALNDSRGQEKVIGLIGPSMSFGEPPMIVGRPYIATAEAIVDTRLFFIRREVILEQLNLYPCLSHNIITCLSERLYRWMGELEHYTLHSGTERVIAYLLNEHPQTAADGTLHINLPVKKGVIASRLNLTHEHFSRILRSLSAAGLIHVSGPTICIPNIHRLHMAISGDTAPIVNTCDRNALTDHHRAKIINQAR